MLQEDFNIFIKGIQSLDNESGEINLNTMGTYTRRGNTRFIAYKEYDADNPAKSHTAVLKVEPGKVTVSHGHSGSRLILEKGKRHLCMYDTGFGAITMGVFTSFLEDNLQDSGGKLQVKYTLDIDSNLSSCNEIQVEVRRRRPQEAEN